MVIPEELLAYLEKFAIHTPSPPLTPLLSALKGRFKNLETVLFYGSCLQEKNELEGLVDLYALVRSYRQAYPNPVLALANYLLPPNVFYLEKDFQKNKVRAKYAVMALWQFERAVNPKWFHSYFWGRFAQPAALVWWKDDLAAKRALRALAQAVVTFLKETVPLAPARGHLRDLWLTGLKHSYRAELRPERPERLLRLWVQNEDYFVNVTSLAQRALPFPFNVQGALYEAHVDEKLRKRARLKWRARILLGKPLSVLRLAKACFTFQAGVDYALWKIERHSGKRLEVSSFFRKHPFFALLFYGWKALLTQGVR